MSTATAETTDEFTLLNADRCDRCGAPALVATAHLAGVLMFCAHHANEHLPALLADDRVTVIADQRHRLSDGVRS